MVGIAWSISSNRRQFPWRIVLSGIALQFLLAMILILPGMPSGGTADGNDSLGRDPASSEGIANTTEASEPTSETTDSETETIAEQASGPLDNSTPPSESGNTGILFFSVANEAVAKLSSFVEEGSEFVFGMRLDEQDPTSRYALVTTFAFGVLPTVIFFSCLMSVLYHIGAMQWIVRAVAFVVQKTLGTSGPETLAAAANVFVGHTEAPLVVRPYLAKMTQSELFALMTGGFATVTGSLIVVYASFGAEPGHLLTACLISAPAALLVAKIIYPETNPDATEKSLVLAHEKTSTNVIGAAANGASEGLKLALNIGAMLIAFLAMIALLNFCLEQIGLLIDYGFESVFGIDTFFDDDAGNATFNLSTILGYVFCPIAWLMGIPAAECISAGQILGVKMAANEIFAYEQMSSLVADGELSLRTRTILTYALAGFANFSAIGIQIGGIGGLEPKRKDEIARLAFKAMIGGTLACNMTACIASILIP
jgi:CNT family concentrative nucleoside transporter